LWTHADGRPYADAEAEAALITSATMAEWELAEALRRGPDQARSPASGPVGAASDRLGGPSRPG
jgi:hypothetical protein